jgi:hypothetical protein
MSTEPELRAAMQRMLEPVSPSWVAEKVGVTRQQVDRWKNGHYIREKRVNQVAAAIRTLLPDAQEEDPPPQWARDLTADIRKDLKTNREMIVAALAQRTTLAALEGSEPLLSQIRDALARVERRLGE